MSYLSPSQIRAIKDLPCEFFLDGINVINVHDVTYAMHENHKPMRYINRKWEDVPFKSLPEDTLDIG